MAIPHSMQDDAIEKQPLAALFSRLIADASALVRGEVALAKAELSEAATNAKLGAATLGLALVVLLSGALSLIAALILGLAQVIEPWLAALLVGIALTGVGFMMLQLARNKMKVSTPKLQRTQSSLRADAAMLARRD
jgi:uncharacterized membrane protein YqjE